MFKRNDQVRIARDLYPDDHGSRFPGMTGTVASTGIDGAAIAGLDPDSDQTYWFFNDEIEKA